MLPANHGSVKDRAGGPRGAEYRTLCRGVAVGFAAIALGACGGGGGGGSPAPSPAPGPSSSGWVTGTFLPPASFAAQCVTPRTGTDPDTGQPYRDVQGTVLAQNNWLRSWSNDLYLWYDEIADRDPGLSTSSADYFDLLKTPATTASGRPKDRFHFTYDTAQWLALSQSGVSAGYGLEWAVVANLPPRQVVVAYTDVGPAAAAGLQRGDVVLTVDGVDVVSSNTQGEVDTFVAGLYPVQAGEMHTFTLRNPQTLAVRSVTMQSANVTASSVQNVRTIATVAGRVGYMQFNDHLATAEDALVAAIDTLRQSPIDDLVLDIRYNGGGLLAIASELAYMIAGPAATAGQTFERLRFNNKHTSIDPVTGASLTPFPFADTTLGFGATSGVALPTLNLSRVFVLTGPTTCSASESIINSLRGVNVQVIQIGSTTCGKPYGFYPQDNCGTTYFTIEFKGVNAADFGDYTDGFAPANAPGLGGVRVAGCSVADDFGHALGDPTEGRFAAALAYRLGGGCPAPSGLGPSAPFEPTSFGAVDGLVLKPLWLQNRSLLTR
jgi:carboxyl-terminal processing protease